MQTQPSTVRRWALALAVALAGLAGAPAQAADAESGLAAVYTPRLNGHRTASGERYDKNALTAAHKTLPFGTKVRVTSERTHKSVVLRINDRGPVQEGRVLDISSQAARALGLHPRDLARVKVEVVGHAPARRAGQHRRAA
ncbi:septal ring lytic transglycosylase RlpA family protein [Pseudorhodoferax sp.]|uniref:septal ring lytic transglycosylase RlpA family protein n=1 Tax=Pseudorhodoferax sp. TaxID=1993553 RepID=UPI0039E41C6F